MKKAMILFALVAGVTFMLLPVQDSHATPVSVGDHIYFQDGPGTGGGGEFEVYAYGTTDKLFNTFCIEYNEHISYNTEFVVDDISTEARAGGAGGPSPDPISAETAYLYHNFYWGTLEDYAHNDVLASDLQKAIWYLEQEIDTYTYTSKDYVTLAQTAVSSGAWSGLGDVRVINLTYTNGNNAQDQLVVAPVPEPATMILFGMGLIGIAGVGRKQLLKKG